MLQNETVNCSDDQAASDEDSYGQSRDFRDSVSRLIDANPPFRTYAWVQLPSACTLSRHSIRIEHDRLAGINNHDAPLSKG